MNPDKNGRILKIGDWILDCYTDTIAEITGIDKENDPFVRVFREKTKDFIDSNWWVHRIEKISEGEAMLHILENS